jgi:hypothetical protein
MSGPKTPGFTIHFNEGSTLRNFYLGKDAQYA